MLSQNNILSPSQFGFRSLHSTEAAIHGLITNVYDAFNNNQYCMSIFIGLSKDFDSIDRIIALEKLHFYGLRGTILKWFKSYFSNRRQLTVVGDSKSSTKSVNYGVPRGSVLGPLIFIIYMNDIVNISDHNIRMLADDAVLFDVSDNLPALNNKLQQDLPLLNDWFIANKLTLNVDKTKYMIFHRPLKDAFIARHSCY